MSYFIVPLEGSGAEGDWFRPKYVRALCKDDRQVDFANACLAHATTTPAIDAQILNISNLDVIAADNDTLDSPIQTVGPILESMGIPSGLAVVGMTNRMMFRRFVAMAQFVHRVEYLMNRDGLFAKLQLKGNLDVQIGSLPLAVRQRWAEAADSLGLDRTGIVSTDPLREVLRNLGFQIFAGRVTQLGNL
jgi:hypothetical protein